MKLPPEDLNLRHVRALWAVAREGGVSHAAEALGVAPSTVSSQVAALGQRLGTTLLRNVGRSVELTEEGATVARYADEIFALERELRDAVEGRLGTRPLRLQIGVADVVPKQLAARLVAPLLGSRREVRLACREGHPDALLGDAAAHRIDLVLLDAPAGYAPGAGLVSRRLGASRVTVLGSEPLARRLGGSWPSLLDGAPMLLPGSQFELRRRLDVWLRRHRLRPVVLGEFDDSGLMKAVAESGVGLVAVPEVIADSVAHAHRIVPLGRLDGLEARYYAVSAERRDDHPALDAVVAAARSVFGTPP